MQPTTHVITTCTATKTVDPVLRWSGHDVESWTRALQTLGAGASLPVRDLYAGPAWAASTRLFDAVAGEAYVASAGLGLVRTSEHAPSYDATFSSGADTSISEASDSRRLELRDWWSGLCSNRGLSLECLADDPSASILLVASGAYLEAMHDDLQTALGIAGERLVVVGVDAHRRCSWLNGNAPRFDARVLRKSKLADEPSKAADAKRLPGGTATLGTVVAHDLYVRTGGKVSAPAMQAAARDLMADLPPTTPHRREQLGDDDVIRWVRQNYDPTVQERRSATALLRLLRDSGKACEQSRFGGLFNQATANLDERLGATG